MAGNVTIDANAEKELSTAVNFAKLVKQTYGRNSLTRASQNSIAQFPVIMSADIPLDDAMIIAKGLEAQYAAMMVGVISMHSDYDRRKYPNPGDYLKTFHDNSSIPAMFRSMDSQLEGATAIECTVASAILTDMGKLVPKEVVMECWGNDDGISSAMFNGASLNAKYTPHSYTQGVMESVVGDLRKLHVPAMEADGSIMDTAVRMNRPVSNDSLGNGKFRSESSHERKVDRNGNLVVNDRNSKSGDARNTGSQKFAEKSQKMMADLEPTLINLQLNSHSGNGQVITHNVVYGIKTKVQAIPQQYIIEGLVGGVKGSRRIFDFIRWTEGDFKLIRDGIFGFDRAKTDAVANRDIRTWLDAIRVRRRNDGYSKALSGQGLPPITTVVVSSYEVARVAEESGFDLSEPFVAAKLIKEYYMLGFIIVDTETGMLSCMFDGDTKFFQTSVSALKQKTKSSNETDLTQFAAFMRAMGR